MVPVVTPSVPSMAPVPSREYDHNGELLHGFPVQDLTAAGHPRQNVGTYKDGPAIIRRLPIDGESYKFSLV
jgi:hypothetical protein